MSTERDAAGRRAKEPFRFVSCMELREILSKRAMDEQRLLEIIEEVHPDSIYYHTHTVTSCDIRTFKGSTRTTLPPGRRSTRRTASSANAWGFWIPSSSTTLSGSAARS